MKTSTTLKLPHLTLKTARILAQKVVGTSKGLEKDRTVALDTYNMQLGELSISIQHDWFGKSGCILVSVRIFSGSSVDMLFNPETLEENFGAEDARKRQTRHEMLRDWVNDRGADFCKAKVDQIWAEG